MSYFAISSFSMGKCDKLINRKCDKISERVLKVEKVSECFQKMRNYQKVY